jgi:hypothetical protein
MATPASFESFQQELYGLTPEEIALVEGTADAQAETALEA